ncbi:type I-F CRISPR-associated protein Csy2 [Catenovulum sediminis]|uniref:Type I-F CRISPR-associated protein Csy2 n=1 Tax=Catenovulum sediminis TaxID=1740262 RepID=A0ABV1RJU9_9ALTE
MSQYLLLKKLSVQNANAIAGLTYGFPAITNFLGFAHAISRKLPNEMGVQLGGVAVISHKNIVHARQPKGWGDYVFALSRNPLTHQGKTAPINEEGRMNMQISLLIEVSGVQAGNLSARDELLHQVEKIIPNLRLAGGQITEYEQPDLVDGEEATYTLRRLMPGFALIDQSQYLAEHYQTLLQQDGNACLLDAWCDFAQLKFKAEAPKDESEHAADGSDTAVLKAEWHYEPKPKSGYLVPINCGYCAISPVYEAGKVANVRDQTTPVVFAESAYSIGEWKSVHALEIQNAVWRYEHQYPWYLAKTEPFQSQSIAPDDLENESSEEEMPY